MTDTQDKPKRIQSTTKTSNASFYMGTPDKKAKRLAALDTIAERFNISTAGLIQMIADGLLEVRPGIIPDDPAVLDQYRARHK